MAGLSDSHGVRMCCLVPGWMGLDRAHAEVAAKSPRERAGTPPLIPPAELVRLVLELIRNGRSGSVVELLRGDEPARVREA